MTTVCEICGHSNMTNGACSNSRCERYPNPEMGVSLTEASTVYPPLSLFSGRKWGNWTLDSDSLELVHPYYRINLEEMNNSAEMLDWIFQVEQKAWATYKDLADLLTALSDIFNPQGTLCSGGSSKEIDATPFLRARVTHA